jgi:MFS-type transporter involved in bile tolerance (Atg22 family)
LSTALMLGSSQFFSWYLGTLFPLSVLVQGTFLGQSVIAISVGQLLGFTDLRRKAIGFFLICTLIPLLLVWWSFRRRYRARNPESVANGLQQNTAGT